MSNTFEAVMNAKKEAREKAIEKLRDEAKGRGQMADRAFWSMIYDFEMAPMTTNRKQLDEIGITVTKSCDLSDKDLPGALKAIIDGLGSLSIYLLHTAHLSDRELYVQLEKDILDEEVRDLPADGVAREFIDLCMPDSDETWERYGKLFEGKPRFGRDASLPRPAGMDREQHLVVPPAGAQQ